MSYQPEVFRRVIGEDKADCGCFLDVQPSNSAAPSTFTYCRIHRAALALLAAVEAQIARDDGKASPFQKQIHPGRDCEWCSNCVWALGFAHAQALVAAKAEVTDAPAV